MNNIKTNNKKNIMNTNFFEKYKNINKTELGDLATCEVMNINYENFKKLAVHKKLEIIENSLHNTLEFLIDEHRSFWGLNCDIVSGGANPKGCDPNGCDPKGCNLKGCNLKGCDLNEFLSAYSYNYKFTLEHLMNCDCMSFVVNKFMDLEVYKEQVLKQQVVKQQVVKEQVVKEQVVKQQVYKEQVVKEREDFNNEIITGRNHYNLNLNNPSELLAYKLKYGNIKNEIYNKALNFLNKYYFEKDRVRICPYLYKELINTLNHFNKDYDLKKAKVREVLRSIINYQISLYNSNLHSANSGMFEEVSDRLGNKSNRVTQNEYYKMKLNNEIIKSIKILDEMIEGNKNLNLNVNVKSIPLNDVLKLIDTKQI